MKLLSFVFGSRGFFVEKTWAIGTINLLSRLDIPYEHLERDQEGGLYFTVPSYKRRLLEGAFASEGITWELRDLTGIPQIFQRYKKRWGIAVGALIFVFLTAVSGTRIWCIEMSGNSKVEDAEIISVLASLGCGVGDSYKNIDFAKLHNQFLLQCKDIAWIAVNMDGTHAHVEVRETLADRHEEDRAISYNVVAAEDGQIEQIAAYEGKPQIAIGDTVRKGELLLSGVISYGETGLRYESAAGEVYAKVIRDFMVEVPLKTEQKVPTGRKTSQKTFTFFQFKANLFLNSGIPYDFYDTIYTDKQIYLFDSIALPLWVKTGVYEEYEMQQITLTEEEAKTLAYQEYRGRLKETLADAQLLEKTVTAALDEDGVYRIHCRLYCLANIAVQQPLTIQENQDESMKAEQDGSENH